MTLGRPNCFPIFLFSNWNHFSWWCFLNLILSYKSWWSSLVENYILGIYNRLLHVQFFLQLYKNATIKSAFLFVILERLNICISIRYYVKSRNLIVPRNKLRIVVTCLNKLSKNLWKTVTCKQEVDNKERSHTQWIRKPEETTQNEMTWKLVHTIVVAKKDLPFFFSMLGQC